MFRDLRSAYARAAQAAHVLLIVAGMHALARVRLVIARFATVSMVLAVVATLGGTVVLLSYGLPAAGLRRGAAPAVVTPDLENAAASAARAEQHARLSTVPVDEIERVQQQLAAFVSSGQLPEVSLAEIPDLGFAIDDSTFEGDPLKALTEVTGDLDAAEPQLAHLGPSLTSLVGGGGGGFGGGGGGAGGGAGVAGSGTTEISASEGRDGANEQGVQSLDDRGESNGGGRAENGGTSSTGHSSENPGSGPANNGSASNGSATNGRAGGVSTPTSAASGGAPAGGPTGSGLGGASGVSATVTQVPEPSSMLLIGLGLVGAAATRRRRPAR